MNVLFSILFFASLITLLVGLAKPKLFKKKDGQIATRKEIATVCGIFMFIFFMLVGATSGAKSQNNTEQTNSSQTAQSIQPTATDTPNSYNVGTTVYSEPTETQKETPQPTKLITLEERIKAKVPDATSILPDDAIDLTTNQLIPGKKDVEIDITMTGEYLDINGVKQASWNRTTKIIGDVFPVDDSIDALVIFFNVPITNAYGKKTTSMLDAVTITRATYNQIDFSNFDYKNIPNIADHYVENHNIKD